MKFWCPISARLGFCTVSDVSSFSPPAWPAIQVSRRRSLMALNNAVTVIG
jgi:hypothetical protein